MKANPMTIDITEKINAQHLPGTLDATELAGLQARQTPVETVEVPAYCGRGLLVKKGQLVRVTNIEGAQIGDIFVVNATDPSEVLSPAETRNFTFRTFPALGQAFRSNRRRPILTFVDDRSTGQHDMLFHACSQEMYQFLGASEPHPNCRDNYLAAIRDLAGSELAIPEPINVFQNSPVVPGGALAVKATAARAGDSVTFRAEMDIYFVLTSCSWDLAGSIKVNGDRCTPLRLEILE